MKVSQFVHDHLSPQSLHSRHFAEKVEKNTLSKPMLNFCVSKKGTNLVKFRGELAQLSHDHVHFSLYGNPVLPLYELINKLKKIIILYWWLIEKTIRKSFMRYNKVLL